MVFDRLLVVEAGRRAFWPSPACSRHRDRYCAGNVTRLAYNLGGAQIDRWSR
jgi:hypothetical protein